MRKLTLLILLTTTAFSQDKKSKAEIDRRLDTMINNTVCELKKTNDSLRKNNAKLYHLNEAIKKQCSKK